MRFAQYPRRTLALLLTECDSGYERKLALAQSHLESILAETDTSLNLLSTLAESFTAVETQTGAFEKQCESVSKEQAQMTKVVTDIEENLKYYSFLEPATKRLNAPTVGAMVKSQEFSDLLSKLDECLEYMTSHVSQVIPITP